MIRRHGYLGLSLVAILVGSCGPQQATSPTGLLDGSGVDVGEVSVTVFWPRQGRQAGARLIPVAARSVRVRAVDPSTDRDLGNSPLLLVAPVGGDESTDTFEGVPVQQVRFVATAHPDEAGEDTPQARAEVLLLIHRGLNDPLPLEMASTVTAVTIAQADVPYGQPGTVPLKATVPFTATAWDNEVHPVLVADRWVWEVSNSDVARIIDPVTGGQEAKVQDAPATVDVVTLAAGSTGLSATQSEPDPPVSRATQLGVPQLSVTETALDFGSDNPPPARAFSIQNSGQGSLVWDCTPSEPWIAVNPPSGTGDTAITVSVNRDVLASGAQGTSPGYVAVSSGGGPDTVSVSVDIPQLSVDPPTRDFGTYDTRDPNENRLAFAIGNAGPGLLHWRCSASPPWITLNVPQNEPQGSNQTTVTVDIDGSSIVSSPGRHEGSVLIESLNQGGTASVSVSVDIPGLSVDPPLLDFGHSESLQTYGTFYIHNAGTGDLQWTCTSSAPWIKLINPPSGKNEGTITVLADRHDLSLGESLDSISISSDFGDEDLEVRVERTTGGVDVVVH